jgi:hypothetical protein
VVTGVRYPEDVVVREPPDLPAVPHGRVSRHRSRLMILAGVPLSAEEHPRSTHRPKVGERVDHSRSLQTTKPQVNRAVDLGLGGTPPGTRTPNPLVKSERFCVSGGDE